MPHHSSYRTSRFLRPPYHLRHASRGAALVIVLAFVVLLTGLIIAFFSRATNELELSNSSASQAKADLIARGAAAVVVGDLRQEIAAASTPSTVATVTVYAPKKDSTTGGYPTMIPALAGIPLTSGSKALGLENLVKRSAYDTPFYPATANYDSSASKRAANSPTTTVSLNGRSITPARWNAPLLITKANLNSDTDFTPVSAFVPPDWVLVGRDGSNPGSSGTSAAFGASGNTVNNAALSNGSFVVGRYAYTVYDEGGLLDANVAGYPPAALSASATGAAQLARKGSTAFADLSTLPGLDSSNPKQSAILNGLVAWRDWVSLQTDWTATPPKVAASPILSGALGGVTGWNAQTWTNYYNFVLLNKTSFMLTAAPAVLDTGGGHYSSDRPIASRRTLMSLLLKGFLSHSASATTERAKTQNALQYLTHYSRDLNTPSWGPTNPTPAKFQTTAPPHTIDYETEAAADANTALAFKSRGFDYSATGYSMPTPNRELTRVRWSQNRTIKDWDGNDVQVKAGDPIVRRRFPLSRIDLFRQYDAANATDKLTIAKKIRYSFGLIPDTGLPGGWVMDFYNYRSNALNPGNVFRLMTVDEMDAPSAPANSVNFERREPNFFELIRAGILRGEMGNWSAGDDDRDAAIMATRIGANIIDQYDADSYPTMIRLAPSTGPTAAPFPMQIAGIENIPYISEVMFRGYRKQPSQDGQDAERQKAWLWMEFELWNPHANAGQVPTSGTLAPPKFRVVGVSGKLQLSPQPNGTDASNMGGDGSAAYSTNSTFYWSTGVDYGAAYGDSTPYQIQFTYPGTSSFTDPTVLGSGDASSGVTYGDQARQVYSDQGSTGATEQINGVLLGYSDNTVAWPDWNLSPKKHDTPGDGDDYAAKWFGVEILPFANSLPPTWAIEFQDARYGNRWVSYQGFNVSRNHTAASLTPSVFPNSGMQTNSKGMTVIDAVLNGCTRIDPRGSRFWQGLIKTVPPTPGFSVRPNLSGDRGLLAYQYFQNSGNGEYPQGGTTSGGPIQLGPERWSDIPGTLGSAHNDNYVADMAENRPTTTGVKRFSGVPDDQEFQTVRGRDGILRPGDSDRDRGVHPLLNTTIGPNRKYLANVLSKDPAASALVTTDRLNDRPVILNRPFQSVGELAYAFRDLPWKTINFSSSVSAESGLLDLFCLNESAFDQPLAAGRVNLNSARPEVLSAILSGAARKDDASVQLSGTNAASIAQDFIAMRSSTPLRHRSDLVNSFYSYLENNDKIGKAQVEPYPAIKTRQEAIARALAEAGQTRTWNLLVDVVAQSGRYPATASDLSKFVVRGEKRYWLHVAIDRFTGAVVDQQLEPAFE